MNTNDMVQSLVNLPKSTTQPSQGCSIQVSRDCRSSFITYSSLLLLFLLIPVLLLAQVPTVTSFTPARNALNIAKDTSLTVTFSTDINQSTLNNSTIKINGSLSGLHRSILATTQEHVR